MPGALFDALQDTLALPVTIEGVFVEVVQAVAEKERVPVTDPENVLLPEGEPE